MFRSFVAGALAVACFAVPAAAQNVRYDCQIKNAGERGWIAPDFVLIVSPGSDQVAVLDGIIFQANNEKPIGAKINRTRGDEIRFTWSLNLPTASGGSIPVRYTGTLDQAQRSFNVEANLTTTRQRHFSRGTCPPRS